MRWFKKINASQKLFLSSGKWLSFDAVDGGLGVIAVGNPKILSEMYEAINAGRGALSEINEEEYNELKKKLPTPSAPKWREEFGADKINHLRRTTTPPLSKEPPPNDVVAAPVSPTTPIQPAQVPKPTALRQGVA